MFSSCVFLVSLNIFLHPFCSSLIQLEALDHSYSLLASNDTAYVCLNIFWCSLCQTISTSLQSLVLKLNHFHTSLNFDTISIQLYSCHSITASLHLSFIVYRHYVLIIRPTLKGDKFSRQFVLPFNFKDIHRALV